MEKIDKKRIEEVEEEADEESDEDSDESSDDSSEDSDEESDSSEAPKKNKKHRKNSKKQCKKSKKSKKTKESKKDKKSSKKAVKKGKATEKEEKAAKEAEQKAKREEDQRAKLASKAAAAQQKAKDALGQQIMNKISGPLCTLAATMSQPATMRLPAFVTEAANAHLRVLQDLQKKTQLAMEPSSTDAMPVSNIKELNKVISEAKKTEVLLSQMMNTIGKFNA